MHRKSESPLHFNLGRSLVASVAVSVRRLATLRAEAFGESARSLMAG